MKIATLNKISEIGLNELKPAYEISDDLTGAAGVLVRSAAMHDMEFGDELHAIARAGAGVNNIPVDRCADEGIVVFNTPGANANAVKELVLAGLLMSSRDLIGGNAWAKTLTEDVAKAVEKGKGMFAGCEIAGKTLGVIGLGAIGAKVANTALNLGMKVIGYDPFISIDGAWRISKNVVHATELKQVYENCDYITIHVPLTPDTNGFINKETISQMKQGVVILNYARAALVADEDIKAALSSGKVRRYVTDFPDGDIASYPGVIAFPHLGASTEESEENCAYMAAIQLKDYLENGIIKNSVNYPEMNFARLPGQKRVVVLHKNVPTMLSQISGEFSKLSLNIDNMQNRSKKEYACTVLDVTDDIPAETEVALKAIDGVIRVRILD